MAVGRSVPFLDSVDRVTGKTEYAFGLKLPEMLVAKILRSPYPHARVVKLDSSAAEKAPGVVAILKAEDLDQPGGPRLRFGHQIVDQTIVAVGKVRFVGDPVVLIAAESEEAAEAAMDLVEVEYEELPGVYDPVQAIQPGAPVLHDEFPDNIMRHAKLRHGDLEEGFSEADEIIEETYTSPVAQQVSLEQHMIAAQWQEGHLTVWSSSQSPYVVRKVLAELFQIEPEAVRVIVPQLGGGFGGKAHLRIEPLVAALAWKVNGRPVMLKLSRAEEFFTVTKHAATVKIKSGVKRDGTLTSRQVTLYWGAGAYADNSPTLVRSAMVRAGGPYRIPAIWVDSFAIYTNLPSAAAYRGAMSSQTTWAYESHMDTIAHKLGLDPLEFRRKNLLVDGDTFASGQVLEDIHFMECLEATAKGLGWGSRPRKKGTGVRRKGYGLAVMIKSSPANSRSEARLVLGLDGKVTLYTSVSEMGQGAHTALAQIAAEGLKLPLERMSVVGPDTLVSPFESSTSSSRSTYMMGNAVIDGATELTRMLVEKAALLFELPPEDLAVEDGEVLVKEQVQNRLGYEEVLQRVGLDTLEAIGKFQVKGEVDPETGQGVASPHYHQGAGACEVEVDTETGKVKVLRYYVSSYAGRVVNPAMAKLQNDGNVIYGLGPSLFEEMVFDQGQPANLNLSDYMVPSFLDIPEMLHSVTLESEGADFHGIGEMTLPSVAPAIGNAIFDAIGIRIRDLPMTPERVLRALRHDE